MVLCTNGKYHPKDAIPYPRIDDIAYWIREKYNIEVWAEPYFEDPMSYKAFVSIPISEMKNAEKSILVSNKFKTFDNALETAVIKALEIVEQKKY